MFVAALAGLTHPQAVRDSPVSVPHVTTGGLGLKVCAPGSAFMCFCRLELRSSHLRSTCLPREQSPQPCSGFFVLLSVCVCLFVVVN